MTIRYDRPVSHAAYLSCRLGQFAFLMFVVVLVANRFGFMVTPYFVALLLLSVAFAALAIVFAAIGLMRLWQVAAKGGGAAVKGLVYALPPLLLFGFATYDYLRYPPIHDISTDVIDAPPWLEPSTVDQLWLRRPAEVGPEVREVQMLAYPALTGRRYDGALDRVYQAVSKVAQQQGITIVKTEGVEKTEADIGDLPAKTEAKEGEEEAVADTLDNVPVPLPRPELEEEAPLFGRDSDVLLQGEIRTLVLGLRFDTIIRLREEAETTLVDIRIASRYGPHDLGMGADLAESYLKALDVELLGIAGD